MGSFRISAQLQLNAGDYYLLENGIKVHLMKSSKWFIVFKIQMQPSVVSWIEY